MDTPACAATSLSVAAIGAPYPRLQRCTPRTCSVHSPRKAVKRARSAFLITSQTIVLHEVFMGTWAVIDRPRGGRLSGLAALHRRGYQAVWCQRLASIT